MANFPKNKTQLKKWFKDNIGVIFNLQRGIRIYNQDGTLANEQLGEPLLRIVEKAQTNAVAFLGEEFDNEGNKAPLKTPSWVYFDTAATQTFCENGFESIQPKFESRMQTKDGLKEVLIENFLRYKLV